MSDLQPRVVPARPHHKLTPDGRRLREVLSYSRRGSRFTPRQAEAWAAHHDRWVIPDDAVDEPGFSSPSSSVERRRWSSRSAPGIGEATAALAATRPERQRAGLRGVAPRRRRHALEARRCRRRERAAVRCRRGLVDRASARPVQPERRSGRSSPTRGTRRSTTSAGSSTPTSPGWWRAGSCEGARGGWRPTGPSTPSRWWRCSTPSHSWLAVLCRAGTNAPSPASSARVSRSAARITDLHYTRLS